ncbi:uncharacterized protein LOC131256027 [Magnolia sinica]|uniref:uncharacterized protein LOC131256027 n=1 Tax=Magnolia sinica TaxID=86752 RepID=UPI0026588E84|nr:uncharacterized protein LOC131256027 [Magnolia sinica]
MKKSSLSPLHPKHGEPSNSGTSHARDHVVRHEWAHPRIEEEASKHDRSHARDHMVNHELGHVRDTKPVVKRTEPRADDINECAEAFIQRFRQDLHIQRLESIENYEQMLARGL